jgi:hypothetical protein
VAQVYFPGTGGMADPGYQKPILNSGMQIQTSTALLYRRFTAKYMKTCPHKFRLGVRLELWFYGQT